MGHRGWIDSLPSCKNILTWKSYPEPFYLAGAGTGLTCVAFHDSSGKRIQPYLAENFRKSVFVWGHQVPMDVFKAVVLKEKPDLVVEEIVERMVRYMNGEPGISPR